MFYDGLDFDDGTEYGRYREHDARREKFRRKLDHLSPDGDLEKDTETGIKYRGQAGERSKNAKKGDNLNPLDGNLDGNTETLDKYSAKYGRRASKTKPKTALYLPDGRIDDKTSNQEYLSNMEYGERVK